MGILLYTTAVLADSPKALWKLDEASGNFADSSGNGNASTGNGPSGTVTYRQPSLLAQGGGYSVRYNGGSYTSLPTCFDWSLAFTLEFWLKKNSNATTYNAVFGKDQDSANIAFVTYSPGGMSSTIKPNNVGAGSNTTIATGTVYHIAVTVTSGVNPTISWYLNGAADGGGAVTSARNNTGSVRFSATPDGFWGYLDGWLQLASAYDTVLSAARILAHYNAAVIPDAFQQVVG